MHENNEDAALERLPLVPLRGTLVYPNITTKLDIERDKSIAAVESALGADNRVILVPQRDSTVDNPEIGDICTIGTVATVKFAMHMPDSTVRLMVHGDKRVKVCDVSQQGAYLTGGVLPIQLSEHTSLISNAKMRVLKKLFSTYARMLPDFSGELAKSIVSESDADTVVNLIAANILDSFDDRIALLEMNGTDERVEKLTEILAKEIKLIKLETEIQQKALTSISSDQKAYFLREQMRAIKSELGEDDSDDIERLTQIIEKTPMNDEALKQAKRELAKLNHTPQGSPEASVSRNYIDCLIELPWGKKTKDQMDIEQARKILERDHYGLNKVKDRILEFLAVGMLKGNMRGSILCLVGPPGVGKTSIAMSIARATGRKFTRMSLGGVHDEAEIRGHRRTYLGSMPGKIISNIRKCGSMNPVFLLDEIDKMGSDYRGDPAFALLEALDPEQNSTFEDHYLDCPFDLSDVLFITTANSVETIPAPLLDRMDVIRIGGYTPNEKLQIAVKYLWPKQLSENGLTKSQARIRRDAIEQIITGYTREAGVRELERRLGEICRKVAVKVIGGTTSVTINASCVLQMLGPKEYISMPSLKSPSVGVVNALAWTNYGGDTLSIEVAIMPGKGNIDLTGSLGDVMKESARTALSYIRSKGESLGVTAGFFEKHDLHINVPEGATPKDGPSAGIALCCAMVSAITEKKARQNVAMTGEITLLGRALAIGGVKEKALAAHRMGIDTLLLPKENEKDLGDIPEDIRQALDIHLITDVSEALSLVILEDK